MTDYPTSREPTDDFWEAVYTQRAIRYWEPREVPRELLVRVIEAASKAPSGSNHQPWRFVVVTDPAKRGRIAEAVRVRAQAAASAGPGPRERARTTTDRSQRLMWEGAAGIREDLARAPVFVIPCLYQVSSPTTDPKSLLAGSSIYGAVQNLQLAARALGLGTVMTTAHNQIEDELRAELGIPAGAQPVALIPLGFPAANFGPTKRRPVEEVLLWEEWGPDAAR